MLASCLFTGSLLDFLALFFISISPSHGRRAPGHIALPLSKPYLLLPISRMLISRGNIKTQNILDNKGKLVHDKIMSKEYISKEYVKGNLHGRLEKAWTWEFQVLFGNYNHSLHLIFVIREMGSSKNDPAEQMCTMKALTWAFPVQCLAPYRVNNFMSFLYEFLLS